MKMHAKRYQGTEMDKTLKKKKKDVPTKVVTHCNDQFTYETSSTLGNNRYVNDHSHLKFLR
ncbi:unnamed protein product, partial [Staurois parvus]